MVSFYSDVFLRNLQIENIQIPPTIRSIRTSELQLGCCIASSDRWKLYALLFIQRLNVNPL